MENPSKISFHSPLMFFNSRKNVFYSPFFRDYPQEQTNCNCAWADLEYFYSSECSELPPREKEFISRNKRNFHTRGISTILDFFRILDQHFAYEIIIIWLSQHCWSALDCREIQKNIASLFTHFTCTARAFNWWQNSSEFRNEGEENTLKQLQSE